MLVQFVHLVIWTATRIILQRLYCLPYLSLTSALGARIDLGDASKLHMGHVSAIEPRFRRH